MHQPFRRDDDPKVAFVARPCGTLEPLGTARRRPESLRRSALDDVHRQPAACCLLVLGHHVGASLAHCLDDLVEADMVRAIAAQGHARR